MKDILVKTIDILCINGECYANIIEEKEETEKTWYDKFYLWYRQNFIIIIIVLGCLLIISMIYYTFFKSCNVNIVQYGGDINNTEELATDKGKKKSFISKKYSNYQKGDSGRISKLGKVTRKFGDSVGPSFKEGPSIKGAKKKASKIKKSIGKKTTAAKEKAKAAVKAAPGKIANAISNNIQSFYTLLFSVGIVLGFAFFFMPTICMLVIGLLTYQITKNQVINLITQ